LKNVKELQSFMKEYQLKHNWQIKDNNYKVSKESLLMNHMLLTTEVAEIAEEFRKLFKIVEENKNTCIEDSYKIAKKQIQEDLGREIADCIAYLIKFANHFDINMEESFYKKMKEIDKRMGM
jgi:NTP pyrophosphatase (non-canonical NTP hydrolase)